MTREHEVARSRLVEYLHEERDIRDARVLSAILHVPRHRFLPPELADVAYEDRALPIGSGQTISQPFIVAYMSELLALKGHERVLEVGTGSGYQTAVLARLAREVISLERHPELADRAAQRLAAMGIANVAIHVGDGSQGLPDMAPFDAILVTAVAPAVPPPLIGQLTPQGGRLVLPVGDGEKQQLTLVVREGDRTWTQDWLAVRFVPLVGRYGYPAGDAPPEA
jgi:protein-L-isoaspartate(D-aspartate) O-methyltransferase